MDAAIQINNFLPSPNVRRSLHEQLADLYSDLQSRHKAQKIEMIEYKSKANYWEAQFARLKTRESELMDEVEELKPKLRKREQQLFGRKSKKNTSAAEKNPNAT